MRPPARAVLASLALAGAALGAPGGAAPTSLFPAPGSEGVCPDAPLRLVFDGPAAAGASGKIRVFDAASGTLAASVDVAAASAVESIGGLGGFKYHPVLTSGDEALVPLPPRTLSYHRTYYIIADPGAFRVRDAGSAGIADPSAWRFSTKAAPPPAGSARLTVSAAGDGDFCTVQGAFDFIPAGNRRPVTVFLRKGTYTELVCLMGKHAVTLLGEDRRESVIEYPNNARFNGGGGNPYAGTSTPAGPGRVHSIYRRGVFLAHRCDDLTIARLTIRNTTPERGSQEEALILNGTTSARAVLRDVDLYGHQDTLQVNGQAYVAGCRIEGDVDFMWGTGPCFFEDCVCRSLRSAKAAYYTQVRNPASNHGFVYLRCAFETAPGAAGSLLSRIQPSRFPHSEVVLLDCVLGPGVAPVGWLLQQGPHGEAGDASSLHFWEYRSHDPAGKPIDDSRRLAASRRLRPAEDAATIAHYSDPAFVLGGWTPPRQW